MIRRTNQWPAPGGYGAREPGRARPIAIVGAVVAVVIIAVFLVFRACSGSSCSDAYCATSRGLPPPDGHERLTSVFERNPDRTLVPGQAVDITLPLRERTDDRRNLMLYAYREATQTWEPIAPALLDDAGTDVTATLDGNTRPDLVAVLRRVSAAGHVVAYVNHNQRLHPSAAERVTIVHTRDFRPDAAGGVIGDLSDPATVGIPPGRTVAHYPVISASASEQGMIPILSGILASAAARSNHVQQIVSLVTARNLAGIDIAYFDLPATERTSFALFIAELGAAMKAQGKVLSVTLPAPIRTGERIDEGAYDWAEIGRSADIVKLWPYRDQGTFRRDMPAILQHLVQAVQPASKLVFTVTPYATEKSPEGIRTLTLTQAMGIATVLSVSSGADGRVTTGSSVSIVGTNIDQQAGRSGIAWQPATATVAFTYELNGGRTVWIENVFSVAFKLEYVARYGLGGVAVEDASADPLIGDIWPALVPFIATGQPVLVRPNPADLVPSWEVSAGTREGGLNGRITWGTPTQPGVYTVKLRLSDGVAYFENEVSVDVQARDRPAASPTPGGR